ncbi:Molecular chaperone, DnaK [Sulfitobacter noctilucicola]|uniref:Putative chaperone protein n=1 Tax=Sulfitobacter noctilucicola TaxID=1342301 RepID=A0A7W6M534_9RHOB|nr:Hsp70 family protein [Sulfitobacter noctilucicola]KIN62930.1 Molecular chaperone, DnaK [Sulfitobacter noctilucicola]MBB4172541.1 putative chaperone protein [Sulfitobacter noctilucicola]
MSGTLGIDFGTSNSAAGISVDGTPQLIPLEGDELTMPTAVFFDFESKKMRVGAEASEALLRGDEGRYMRGLKSLLGTRLIRESRMLLGERLDFIDIIARFLHEVKTRAETATGETFTKALSGRPVRFHSEDDAKDAQALVDLKECYARAGFDDVAFMNEPEAAALANRDVMQSGDLGLIVDIGGGTSDFTLFRQKGAQDIDILGSYGVRIGGTDFDRRLSITRVMPQLGMGSPIRHAFGNDTHLAPNGIFNDLATWAKIPFLYGPDTIRAAKDLHKFAVHETRLARLVKVLEEELGHDLAFAVEAGKIMANTPDVENPVIRVGMLKRKAVLPLPAEMMTKKLSGLANQIGEAAEATLAEAQIAPDAVTHLIFVGGSSLMQVVENALTSRLPSAQVHRGAALTAIIDGLALGTTQAF